MAIGKNHIGKVTNENLDDWLSSLGFLYPVSDKQLDRFEKLYENYPYELEDKSIDVSSIINNKVVRKIKVFNLKIDPMDEEIETLKMVARKGQKKIPQHIIDKMKKNHQKGKDGK
ncbi:hypothetical protein ACXIHB_10280 [Tenacibaculum sp. IMCC1]|nr:hypothetical protein KUL118_15620 [Tenacibaculum sp. KUL118]